MKIALIGNMNNNNFAIMRYFRDLGEDAHLFLWANDGVGSLSHFAPENDTWNMDKWRTFIHETELINGYASVCVDLKSLSFPISKDKIRSYFKDFDVLIGSGVAPALMGRINRPLDIFYPYSSGIEFVGSSVDLNVLAKRFSVRGALYRLLREKQIKGLLNARYCLGAELGHTSETFKEIGKEYLPILPPVIYNREDSSGEDLKLRRNFYENFFKGIDLLVFSHARQMWNSTQQYSESEWERANKHNDWLIHGFSEFVKIKPKLKSRLVLLEYGSDVDHAKLLCRQLGLEEFVIWLPKMDRKEILLVLDLVDIGVGEFLQYPGSIWGGTGWEVLSSGKPLLQTFNFSQEEFIRSFGHEPPPILDVKTATDVTHHLVDWCENKDRYIKFGHDAREWFNTYNGIGLAKRWLDLLRAPQQ